jgi:hypothetical protein
MIPALQPASKAVIDNIIDVDAEHEREALDSSSQTRQGSRNIPLSLCYLSSVNRLRAEVEDSKHNRNYGNLYLRFRTTDDAL